MLHTPFTIYYDARRLVGRHTFVKSSICTTLTSRIKAYGTQFVEIFCTPSLRPRVSQSFVPINFVRTSSWNEIRYVIKVWNPLLERSERHLDKHLRRGGGNLICHSQRDLTAKWIMQKNGIWFRINMILEKSMTWEKRGISGSFWHGSIITSSLNITL